jgi:hypothetical protein
MTRGQLSVFAAHLSMSASLPPTPAPAAATSAVRAAPREIALLLTLAAMQFTHVVDFMIMMPLGPQFMRLFAIDPQHFGFLVSVYTFAAAGQRIPRGISHRSLRTQARAADHVRGIRRRDGAVRIRDQLPAAARRPRPGRPLRRRRRARW